MRHVGVIAKSSKFPTLPVDAHCSCQTGGHFKTVDDAKAYLATHFSKVGTADTFELLDRFDEPEVMPLPSVSKPFVSDVTLTAEKVAAEKAAAPALVVDPPVEVPAEAHEDEHWDKKKKR